MSGSTGTRAHSSMMYRPTTPAWYEVPAATITMRRRLRTSISVEAERLEHQLVAAHAVADRLAHRFGLLVDLLEHERLVAALLGLLVVPVELLHLGMLDLDAVPEEAHGLTA